MNLITDDPSIAAMVGPMWTNHSQKQNLQRKKSFPLDSSIRWKNLFCSHRLFYNESTLKRLNQAVLFHFPLKCGAMRAERFRRLYFVPVVFHQSVEDGLALGILQRRWRGSSLVRGQIELGKFGREMVEMYFFSPTHDECMLDYVFQLSNFPWKTVLQKNPQHFIGNP